MKLDRVPSLVEMTDDGKNLILECNEKDHGLVGWEFLRKFGSDRSAWVRLLGRSRIGRILQMVV